MAKQNGTDLGKAYVQIVPSAQGIKTAIEDVMGKPVEEQADKSGLTFGNTLVSKIKGAITLAGIAKFIGSSLTEGGAIQQSIGGVETLFGASAEKLKKYAQSAYKNAGISANSYMEQSTSFAAALVKSCGGNTEKAVEVANTSLVDMSDNVNKFGSNMEDVQNAYQGFAKQNYSMLDNLKLGYSGSKAEMQRLLADAQKLTGVHYDINNLSDVYSAIHAIQENLGITNTTAEEAKTTFEGSFGMVKASVQDMLASLSTGDNVMQSFKNMMSSLGIFVGNNFVPMLVNIGSSFGTILGGIADNIPSMLPVILDKIQSFASSLAAKAPDFIKSGFELLNKLAEGIVSALPVLISKVPTIISTFANIINDNGPTILMCGLQLVGKLAIGIVQAIPTLILNIPKIITAIVDVWSAFNWVNLGKMAITGLGNGIKSLFGFLKNTGKDTVENVLINVMLLPEKLKGVGGKGITFLANGIKSMFGALGGAAKGIINAITGAVTSLPSHMINIGKNVVEGIWKGIWNMSGWLTKKIGDFASGIVKNFKGFLGIHSPSAIMRDMVGRFIGEGIGVGILGSFDTVRNDIASFNNSLVDEFKRNDSFGSLTTFSAVKEVKMQLINEGFDGQYSENRKGDIYQTINITAPDAVDPSEVSRQTRNANRELIQRLKGA